MPNTLLTPTWVTNETALRFMNSVKGIPQFRSYSDQYRQAGAKVGYTVQVRLPQRYTVRRGQAWSPQALFDRSVPVTLSYQSGVDFDWSSAQGTQEIDRVRERYVNPAADVLASDADQQSMADVYTAVYNSVGTPGTTPNTTQTYLDAVVKIFDGSGPSEDLNAVLDQRAAAVLANTSMTLFNPATTISENYRRGRMGAGQLGIAEWFRDQNVPTHTTGTFTSSTPLVDTASQTGSSLITDGWASGATSLKKGDTFTLDGVFSVNPISRVSTSRLQQFTVTADISDTAGAITIPISPSIITSGALQTVTASPANNAPINYLGQSGTYAQTATASKQSLIFHGDAFAFVMADLVEPIGGAKSSFVRSQDYGLSIRFVQQFLIGTDQNGSRLDILFGAATIQERLACRVMG